MKYQSLFILLIGFFVNAQTDFTDQWQELFSYNEVKDFTIVDDNLYAIVENAMFVYDVKQKITTKFSSVNGLSGNITSAVAYDSSRENILIGYENGLLEIIEKNNNVIPLVGLRDHKIIVNKAIKGIVSQKDYTYIYGDFGVSQLNIDDVEFKSTFALSDIGDNSVNDLLFEEDMVYAATDNGLYGCSLTEDITSFSNWNILASGIVSNVTFIDGELYFTIGNSVYNSFVVVYTSTNEILELEIVEDINELVITTQDQVEIVNISDYSVSDQIVFSELTSYNATIRKGVVLDSDLYVNTDVEIISNNPSDFGRAFGVVKVSLEDRLFEEIHPDGPSANDVFSLTASNGEKWVTYGGIDVGKTYNALSRLRGVDYFNTVEWQYYKRRGENGVGGLIDYTKIIVNPLDQTKVMLGSYSLGVVELEEMSFKARWDNDSTGGILAHRRDETTRDWVSDLIVDNNNDIWAATPRGFNNQLFSRYDTESELWTESLTFSLPGENSGINKFFKDQNNNIYAGTGSYGLLIFNADDIDEDDERPTAVLNTNSDKGALPSSEVLCGFVDGNDRIWIGTDLGLVVFDDYDSLYSDSVSPAETIIIEENGIAKELLTNIRINDILQGDLETIWVATNTAGVFQLSADGLTTLNVFDSTNSPLPSNEIIDLEIDNSTGLLYIVTALGVLEYNSSLELEPFGETITEVVAYPNPAIANQPDHDTVFIVAKNGEGLPAGTNVKIIDVSGKLVFEENISNDATTLIGGKIIWDKRNLAGNYVVSGIYIVLVSNADGTQNTSTKIAIIN